MTTTRTKPPFLYTNTLIPLLLAITMTALIPSTFLGPLAGAQSDSANSLRGDFASIQNNEEGVPSWIVAGNWTMELSSPIENISSSTVNATSFDGSIRMVLLNGSAMHDHQLSNFSQTTSEHNATSNSTTFNGTMTVTLRDGPHSGVPASIQIMQNEAISVWLDPASVDNHFGDTWIFGTIWKHDEEEGDTQQSEITPTSDDGSLYG
jgi:hypothetical protein